MNHLSCQIVSIAHGNALCIAKNVGAVSKHVLEHVIVINLAMNFQEINRSGGRWELSCEESCSIVCVVQSPCASSAVQALPCLSWCWLVVVTLNTVWWHTQPPCTGQNSMNWNFSRHWHNCCLGRALLSHTPRRAECAQLPMPFDDAHPAGKENHQRTGVF